MLFDECDTPTAKTEAEVHAALEFFATDPKDVRAFFRALMLPQVQHLPGIGSLQNVLLGATGAPRVLDPSAGGLERDGVLFHPMPYPKVLFDDFGIRATTVDCRVDSPATHIVDFREFARRRNGREFQLLVTNPPFSEYRTFVQLGLAIADVVVLLLPRQVIEPRKTTYREDVEWWRKYRHRYEFSHQRLHFSGSTSSSYQQYAHLVWFAEDIGGGRYMPMQTIPVDDAVDFPDQTDLFTPGAAA